jgi:hypothetical protein
MPEDIPYALEIPRVALTRAVGPEEVALLALRVAQSHLDGARNDRPAVAARRSRMTRTTTSRAESRA